MFVARVAIISFWGDRRSTSRFSTRVPRLAASSNSAALLFRSMAWQQARWLLLAMRRKLMNLESHAHKFVNLTDPNQAKQILRAIGSNVLQEVKDLPKLPHLTGSRLWKRLTRESSLSQKADFQVPNRLLLASRDDFGFTSSERGHLHDTAKSNYRL